MLNRPESQSDARLIRLLADGELDAPQQTALEVRMSGDEAFARTAHVRVESERRLQKAVARTMSTANTPPDLRARVQTALAAEPAEATPAVQTRRVAHAGVVRAGWLQRMFASPQRANALAIAAVLALITGAVLFGIFGRTIDEVPPRQPLDLVANAAAYVDGEHGLCSLSDEGLRRRITYSTKESTEIELSRWLNENVRVFDLSALGYQFLGGSRCDVPLDRQPSGRMLYRKPEPDGKPGPMVSVFVAPARGGCQSMCKGLKQSEWARIGDKSCQHRVLYSTDGRLIYFLVCCDDQDVNIVADTLSLAQAAGTR